MRKGNYKMAEQKAKRAKITPEMIKRVYEMFCSKNSQEHDAIRDILVGEEGMKRGTAEGYVKAVSALMTGGFYFRSISQSATRYFLENIHSDSGDIGLEKALLCLGRHIDSETKYGNVPGLIKIHDEFSARLK